MTIQEVEAKSGLSYENIRFYEREKMVFPVKGPNGYRYFSPGNLQELVKIRFMRTLMIPVNVIKAMQTEDQNLPTYLLHHLKMLEKSPKDVTVIQRLCELMLEEKAEYETLDIKRYADMVITEKDREQILKISQYELNYDANIRITAPWRRFFARTFDQLIYAFLSVLFLSLVTGQHLGVILKSPVFDIIGTVMGILLMLLLEPVMLFTIKTTPGKWILGLSISGERERKLTYQEALKRTALLVLYGMGLGIPIVSLVAYAINFRECGSGAVLKWEKKNEVSLKDENSLRVFAYAGSVFVIFLLLFSLYEKIPKPVNKGTLTVAQFVENYNTYLHFYGYDKKLGLDKSGVWLDEVTNPNFREENPGKHPKIILTVEEGKMTGLEFEEKSSVDVMRFPDYRKEIYFAMISYIGAQNGYKSNSKEAKQMRKIYRKTGYDNYDFEACGVNVEFFIDSSGLYEGLLGSLLGGNLFSSKPREVEEFVNIYLRFKMKKGSIQ